MSEIQAAQNLLLTLHEMQGNRWYHEQEKLRLFSSFELVGSQYGPVTAAEGMLDTQHNNTYGIRIELANYHMPCLKFILKVGASILRSRTNSLMARCVSCVVIGMAQVFHDRPRCCENRHLVEQI